MVIAGKEMQIELDGKIYHCALDITMDYISGKWKTVILWYLRKDARRFSELNRLIPQITEKMLSFAVEATGKGRHREPHHLRRSAAPRGVCADESPNHAADGGGNCGLGAGFGHESWKVDSG